MHQTPTCAQALRKLIHGVVAGAKIKTKTNAVPSVAPNIAALIGVVTNKRTRVINTNNKDNKKYIN